MHLISFRNIVYVSSRHLTDTHLLEQNNLANQCFRGPTAKHYEKYSELQLTENISLQLQNCIKYQLKLFLRWDKELVVFVLFFINNFIGKHFDPIASNWNIENGPNFRHLVRITE